MATLKLRVKHVKNDGTAGIKIDLIHKERHAFIDTNLFVTKKDLTPDGKLKKGFYNPTINKRVEKLREYIHQLGIQANNYDVVQLKDYILEQERTAGGSFIDFIAFCNKKNEVIENTKGKNGTYYSNTAAVEWLKKFTGSDTLNVNDISVTFLEEFEAFMIQNKLGSAGINNYLRAIRTLFKAARKQYNDTARDKILIKHYPFEDYQIKEFYPEKRSTSVDVLQFLINAEPKHMREHLGREMFLLTFCLAGIAPVDLYNLEKPVKGYITYERDKVKHRARRIKIQIKVSKEAQAIIDKYSTNGFLSDIKRYATAKEFGRSCKKGLESLINRKIRPVEEGELDKDVPTYADQYSIPELTLYWARHTFSTIASSLEFDTNLIDYILGHAPSEAKMAEAYITRLQESVDKVVNAVIRKVYGEEKVNESEAA
ncbi:MAG: site-specific integrase [Prevotellaceae bacterium]|jgi:hypothetical protein|nr:site-specific integrase [Prevotellaceae bacterium]